MAKRIKRIVPQDMHHTMLEALASLWPEQEQGYMKHMIATKLAEHFGDRWKDMEHCINCGALMREYTFSPTKLACNALEKLAAEVERSMAMGNRFTLANQVHVPSMRSMTHNEADAGTILRYLGLIAKHKKDGKHVSGMWSITT